MERDGQHVIKMELPGEHYLTPKAMLDFLLATTKAFMDAIRRKDNETSVLFGRCMMETMRVSARATI